MLEIKLLCQNHNILLNFSLAFFIFYNPAKPISSSTNIEELFIHNILENPLNMEKKNKQPVYFLWFQKVWKAYIHAIFQVSPNFKYVIFLPI